MNTRAFTLALIIAVVAMFMVYSYIEDQKSQMIKKYGKEVTVVVAKQDINEFELIDDSKVLTSTVPESFKQPGAFETIKSIENTVALVPVKKGEQITSPRVSQPGGATGLSRQVAPGKRAFAITVTEANAVSKLIRPGDRVDVLAAIDYQGNRKDKQNVQTILQDVLVLSIGIRVTGNIPLVGLKDGDEIRKLNLNTYESFNSVTLELDPFQAQKMFHVQTYFNSMYLTLRNNNDKEIKPIKPTGLYDLIPEEVESAKQYFQKQFGNE